MTGAGAFFRKLTDGLAGFRRSARGGVATLTALALPPVLLIGLGAVELQQVVSDKGATQDAADAAALMGAQQLTISPVGATDRAQAFALGQLGAVSNRSTVTINATAVDKQTMKVVVDTHRDSFFMNLLPPGGFFTHAEATAISEGSNPLCVLIFGGQSSDDIHLTQTTEVQAPACLIHSNQDIVVDSAAQLQGQAVEAVNSATGPITPSASTGAKTISDPFSTLNIAAEQPTFPLVCPLSIVNVPVLTNTTLPAGVHALTYTVQNGVTLTLAPGAHYFCGDLKMGPQSVLDGTAGVTLVFNAGSQLTTGPAANVTLNGSKTGPLAGMVMIVNSNYTGDFTIESDPISNITGAIYAPTANLIIDGSKKAIAGSPWTVVVAKNVQTTGAAQLVINANYGGTDVPVPNYAVGNKALGSRILN